MVDRVVFHAGIKSALAVAFVLALVQSSVGASALDRTDGDFWRYSVTLDLSGIDISELNITDMQIDLTGIVVTGYVLYEYLGTDNVSVDGIDHPVNVMAVTGALGGTVSLIGLEASVLMQGHVFETAEGQGTVKDDITTWTNMTWGIGSFAYLKSYESRVINLYTPPLMGGFDAETIALGGTWDETIEMRTTVMNATTGAVVSESDSTIEIGYSVGPEMVEVSTPAGKFDTYEITASEEGGDKVVYWWSSGVGNIVRQETYLDNSTTSAETMILEDYNDGSTTSILVYVSIGAVSMAFALAVLGLVLLKRRPRHDEPKPPPELLQLPPT